jgi:asparagine synthase (glutamine-hydrolysing)
VTWVQLPRTPLGPARNWRTKAASRALSGIRVVGVGGIAPLGRRLHAPGHPETFAPQVCHPSFESVIRNRRANWDKHFVGEHWDREVGRVMSNRSEDCLVIVKEGPNFRAVGPTARDVGHRVPRPDLGSGIDDGAWAFWRWNGAELTVRTCPHGLIQVYYAVLRDGIAVSLSLGALLDAGADDALDWAGLSVAIRVGHFVGERTPFRHIRVVPPDTELRWSGGDPSVSASRSRDTAPKMQEFTLDEAAQVYLDLVSTAVRRRPPSGPFAVPLSGGRDSRHILLELNAQGHRPSSVVTSQHYLDFSDDDIEIARRLISRLGFDHDVVTIPPYSFGLQARLCELADYCVFSHVWAFTLADRLSRFEIIYDGLNGGTLFGRPGIAAKYRELARADRYEEVVESFLGSGEGWIERSLSDSVKETLSFAVAVNTVRAELDRYRSWPNPWQAFRYWTLVRRETAYYTFKVLRNPIVYCPLDDIDVVNFALSLPRDITIDGRLQAIALQKRFPAFADIPLAGGLQRREPGWYTKRLNNVRRSRFAVNLLLRLVTRPSELVNVKSLATLISSTWLLGRGRLFDNAAPVAAYLMTLERARRTRK